MASNSQFSTALTWHSPFEAIQISTELDGRTGTNRAIGNRPQIAATTDIDAITAWLARFSDSPNTFANYRKEAERLLLWATSAMQKPVSSLTHEDLLAYQHFLSDPQPAALWIMRSGRKVARAHSDWRPFAGPLAPSSLRLAIIILNGMFSWLVAAGYLAGNPLSLSRQRTRKAKPRVTRYLDEETWMEVKRTVDALPRESERDREHYFRLRWLFSLLYLCGLRISEVTQNTMGGFFCRRNQNGEELWWLEVTGKGDKTRIIPATHELMIELARYRREKGLAPFPAPDETTPLLLPIGQQIRPLTRAAVHSIVKQIFKSTADQIRARGDDFESKAQRVEQASAHWLRHTAGSHMANNQVDLRHVRDNLGHESISTTNSYLHSSDDARHRETERHHKIGW
ncbi:MAG: tyrosine-type recombinase/integrase [Burkholderiaceae bacterium]|nr:tyrosine-type recombinase/integrase [Burkholderiaceae bacterium]